MNRSCIVLILLLALAEQTLAFQDTAGKSASKTGREFSFIARRWVPFLSPWSLNLLEPARLPYSDPKLPFKKDQIVSFIFRQNAGPANELRGFAQVSLDKDPSGGRSELKLEDLGRLEAGTYSSESFDFGSGNPIRVTVQTQELFIWPLLSLCLAILLGSWLRNWFQTGRTFRVAEERLQLAFEEASAKVHNYWLPGQSEPFLALLEGQKLRTLSSIRNMFARRLWLRAQAAEIDQMAERIGELTKLGDEWVPYQQDIRSIAKLNNDNISALVGSKIEQNAEGILAGNPSWKGPEDFRKKALEAGQFLPLCQKWISLWQSLTKQLAPSDISSERKAHIEAVLAQLKSQDLDEQSLDAIASREDPALIESMPVGPSRMNRGSAGEAALDSLHKDAFPSLQSGDQIAFSIMLFGACCVILQAQYLNKTFGSMGDYCLLFGTGFGAKVGVDLLDWLSSFAPRGKG